jgi:predicted nucleic acid-binding protein
VVLEQLWRKRLGRLSVQVLSEFYLVTTQRLAKPIDRETARREVRQLEAWTPLPLSADVREAAWQAQDRYGFSWWDSLVVGAARVARCSVLLTEDLQDGQEIGGLRVLNPFTQSLSALGLHP